MRRAGRALCLAALAGTALACAPGDGAPARDAGEEAGRRLYQTHGCAACHGPEGRGDGPLAASLDPPPRDFRDRDGYKRGPAREQIERTLSLGLLGESFSPMPSYPHLTPEELGLLASHVVGLQGEGGPERPGLDLSRGWVRAAPPGARVTAAYFELRNGTSGAVRVTGARCDLAETVEIHESVTEDGVAGMRPRAVVPVAAGESVRFAPGGLHLMLIGLERPASPGESTRLTLLLDGAPSLEAVLEVRREAPAP